MSVLSGYKSAPRQRSNNSSKSDHIFGQVVAYEIKDPKGMRSDPDDVMVVALYRPAFGLAVEQAESGELLTHVKVGLNEEARKSSGGYTPMSILDMKKGKNAAKPTAVGDFVMFKDAELEKGIYRARRVEAAIRNFDPGRHQILCGPTSVFREQENKNAEGETFQSQDGVQAIVSASVPVTTTEELRAAVKNALDYAGQFPETRPQFVLRILEIADNKVVNAVERSGGLAYDKEARVHLDSDASADAWMERDNVKEVIPLLEGAAAESQLIFEVIPMVGFSIVGSSLPSKRKISLMEKPGAAPLTEKDAWRYDDSVQFRFRNEDNQNQAGFADTNLVLDRRTADDGSVSRSYKYFLQRAHPYTGLYSRAELLTDYVKEAFPEVAADLERRANERAKAKAQAAKDKAPAADAAADADSNHVPGMA